MRRTDNQLKTLARLCSLKQHDSYYLNEIVKSFESVYVDTFYSLPTGKSRLLFLFYIIDFCLKLVTVPQRKVLVQIMADKKLITKYVFSNVEVLMLVIHSYDIFTFTMNKAAFISLYTVVEVNVVEVSEVFALSPTLYSVYMKELIKDKSPL